MNEKNVVEINEIIPTQNKFPTGNIFPFIVDGDRRIGLYVSPAPIGERGAGLRAALMKWSKEIQGSEDEDKNIILKNISIGDTSSIVLRESLMLQYGKDFVYEIFPNILNYIGIQELSAAIGIICGAPPDYEIKVDAGADKKK